MSDTSGMVKVELHGPHDEVETLWATPLGDDLYRLENSPFFAYGVSWLDVVEARQTEGSGFPVFIRVVQKSGHRTVRIILEPPADKSASSQAVVDHLHMLGCTVEGYNPSYIVVDIAPDVAFDPVIEFLMSGNVKWEHADPTYNEIHAGS